MFVIVLHRSLFCADLLSCCICDEFVLYKKGLEGKNIITIKNMDRLLKYVTFYISYRFHAMIAVEAVILLIIFPMEFLDPFLALFLILSTVNTVRLK